MSNNTGGPAFPYEERTSEGQPHTDHFGMTLRDYFAAKAMLGLITHAPTSTDVADATNTLAHFSYTIADAMLKAREQ